MRRFSLTLISVFLVCAAMAQTRNYQSADSVISIVDAINNADGTIYIYQSAAIDAIVAPNQVGGSEERASESSSATKSNVGYRIQVFSDNNMRSAKSNAEHRKRLIEQARPEWRTYITFESPYWRVRVGDFRSQTEADAAMRELKASFPSMAPDMKLVRERIK